MNRQMKWIGAAIVVLASAQAYAETYVCKNGAISRRVEIAHQDNDSSKPCTVRYYKDSEQPGAEGKLLWSYSHDVAQCSVQAQNFMQNKLVALGFSCSSDTTQ